MPSVYPSQIVEVFDSLFPASKGMNMDSPLELDSQAEMRLRGIINVIDSCPSELLPRDSATFILCFSAVKTALAEAQRIPLQRSYQSNHVLHPLSNTDDYPLRKLYKMFKECKDEAVATSTAELLFIPDPDYRELLRVDATRVESALANGEWKAATVLAGSLLEALLLAALQRINQTTIDSTCNALKSRGDLANVKIQPQVNLIEPQWSLVHYVSIAFELKMIINETRGQADIAREFRNLIHPAKTIRDKVNCDRGTARAAAAAVDMAVRDLSKFQF